MRTRAVLRPPGFITQARHVASGSPPWSPETCLRHKENLPSLALPPRYRPRHVFQAFYRPPSTQASGPHRSDCPAGSLGGGATPSFALCPPATLWLLQSLQVWCPASLRAFRAPPQTSTLLPGLANSCSGFQTCSSLLPEPLAGAAPHHVCALSSGNTPSLEALYPSRGSGHSRHSTDIRDRDKPRALGILLNPSQCPFTQLKKVDNKTHLIGAWYGLHELNVNKALSPGLRTQ